PAGFDVQLSARSGSMNSGLIFPGRIRTSPLNIQLSSPLSGVVEAMCGSSLPASADPMPTTRLFFCAKAGGANNSAAPRIAKSSFFIGPPYGWRHVTVGTGIIKPCASPRTYNCGTTMALGKDMSAETPSVSHEPYWWDAAPREAPTDVVLPTRC